MIDPAYHLWRCQGNDFETRETDNRTEHGLRSDRDYVRDALTGLCRSHEASDDLRALVERLDAFEDATPNTDLGREIIAKLL
jgi:hypothetical protein